MVLPNSVNVAEVGITLQPGQLVESIRRGVARASKEHRATIHGEAPSARSDVPLKLSEGEGVMHPGRLGAAGNAGDQLRAVRRLLAKPPRLPALRAGEGEAHRQRLLVPAAQMDLSSQSQRIPAGRIHDQLNLD